MSRMVAVFAAFAALIGFLLGVLLVRATAEKCPVSYAVRRLGIECKYIGEEPYAVVVEHGDGSITLQSGAATTTVHSEYHRDTDSFLVTLNNLHDWRCAKVKP